MPLSLQFSVQSRNGLFLNGQSTTTTFRQEKVLEILPTEHSTLVFYQTDRFRIERLPAMMTLQVSNMILFSKCLHTLLVCSKRLVTAWKSINIRSQEPLISYIQTLLLTTQNNKLAFWPRGSLVRRIACPHVRSTFADRWIPQHTERSESTFGDNTKVQTCLITIRTLYLYPAICISPYPAFHVHNLFITWNSFAASRTTIW